jgi:copper transport protein
MTERPGTRSNEQTSARRVRRLSGAIVLLLLALTTLPWGGAVAHAHASLVASDPADGALLVTAPETLQLTFNEDVTLLETTRLGGPGGETPYTAEVDGGLVTLRPGRALEDGRWDLVWQIVSADGHLVGGVLTFTVGTSTEVNEVLEDAPDATTYTDGAVVNPVGTGAPGVLDRILELLGWLALIAALGAILAAKHTPAAWLSAGAVLLPTLRVVDSTDRWGTSAWIIGETRAALAAAIAGGLLFAAALSRGRTRTMATVLAVLAWAAQALLSGHPNVIEPKPLYSALSALHLAGALTWSAAVTAAVWLPRSTWS